MGALCSKRRLSVVLEEAGGGGGGHCATQIRRFFCDVILLFPKLPTKKRDEEDIKLP